jgi:protease I
MIHDLRGTRVALLVAEKGTEHIELEEPMRAVEEAGGEITLISSVSGAVETVHGDLEPGETYVVDATFDDVTADAFDALVIPGGTVGSDTLRGDRRAIDFVRAFFEGRKPVAAICHGPWLLVEADVVRGRTLTSYPTLRTDVRNAGGVWVDKEVVVDSGLVTSRRPDDLQAFCAKLVEEFAEGTHAGQSRSA